MSHPSPAQQATLPLDDDAPDDRIEQAALEFHERHPEVYAHLVSMALALKGQGFVHYGIAALWEALRYRLDMERRDGDEAYKLNNNHRRPYARLIMRRCPELDGFFQTRGI